MIIKRSEAKSIDRIVAVYDTARVYMRANGNYSQWTGAYPDAETVLADIANGNHYSMYDGSGALCGVFAFIVGADSTYARIDGEWLNDEAYGTIHRIASTGCRRGILKACVDFCFEHVDNIRIDTHADNAPMLSALRALGFSYCGVIQIADGTDRQAFQKRRINSLECSNNQPAF